MRLESILKIINILGALGMQLTTSPLSLPLKHPLVSASIPSLGQLKHCRVIFFFLYIKKRETSAGDHSL